MLPTIGLPCARKTLSSRRAAELARVQAHEDERAALQRSVGEQLGDVAGFNALLSATNMAAENLQYLLLGPNDLAQEIQSADREKILDNWKTRPDLETVYENARFRVRRVRPPQSGL